eukprot:8341742-Pyramimonas_sp.AAC.1
MSDGGRREPRPLALASTCRTLRFYRLAVWRGEPSYFSPGAGCAIQGHGQGSAVRLPRTAVDPAAWPLQQIHAHHIIIILVHLSLRTYGQLALDYELVVACAAVSPLQ